MGLTSWVVTTERVKGGANGLVEYGAYLVSTKHANHSGKPHSILPMFGNVNQFVNSAFSECTQVDLANIKGGRRIASYGQSFVFSLPPQYNPTPEEWKKITGDICNALCEHLDLPKAQYQNFLFTNVHQQGSNDHLNLVVSRAFKGEVLKTLDKKSTLVLMKKTFTASVLKHCSFDVQSYAVRKPARTNRNRGRVPKWLYQLNQLKDLKLTEQEIKSAKSAFAKLLESATAWVAANKKKNQEEAAKQEVHFVESFKALQALNKEKLTNRIQEIRQTAEETSKVKFKM